MTARSVRIRLSDIREEIAGIRELTRGADAQSFAASWAMKRAVEHALLKATRPEVPWQKIHGLGNMLRHEYRRIDPDILWSVVTDHLDQLDTAAVALLGQSRE